MCREKTELVEWVGSFLRDVLLSVPGTESTCGRAGLPKTSGKCQLNCRQTAAVVSAPKCFL